MQAYETKKETYPTLVRIRLFAQNNYNIGCMVCATSLQVMRPDMMQAPAAPVCTTVARDCLRICQKHAVPLNLNSQIAVAQRIGCDGIHLPFHLLLQHKNELEDFSRVGVSLHSPEEAAQLTDTPATYVQAGHVFPTDCKAGVPPRGLSFLRAVCQATDLPVFGIGAVRQCDPIAPKNHPDPAAGASHKLPSACVNVVREYRL